MMSDWVDRGHAMQLTSGPLILTITELEDGRLVVQADAGPEAVVREPEVNLAGGGIMVSFVAETAVGAVR